MTDASPLRVPDRDEDGRRSFLVGIATIVLVGLATFWPVLFADFSLWDDGDTIVGNPALNPPTLAGLAERWTSSQLHIYVPLTHSAWTVAALVGYDASGATHNGAGTSMRPWPFKLESVATHLLASVAVFALARRAAGPGWPALAAAIVFCVHPIQVEAVGWTSGLKDVLCGLCMTTSLLMYVDESGALKPSPRRAALALAAMIAATLCKPTAFVLPAMLLVVDRCWNRRAWRVAIVRILPFALAGAVVGAIARDVQPTPADWVGGVAWPERPFVAGFAYAFYAFKLVVPVRFGIDYGLSPAAIARGQLVWVAWLVPATFAAAAWVARRRMPLLGIGLALAAIPIVPVSGLVWFDFSRLSVVADHYAYLAMPGVAIALASGLTWTSRWHVSRGVTTAICLALAAISMRQARTWDDAMSVASNALRVNPASMPAREHLAIVALRTGELDNAESLLTALLATSPADADGLRAMSLVARARGDDQASLAWARRAIAIAPSDARYLHALADAAARAGAIDEAVDALAQAAHFDVNPAATRRQIESLRHRAASTRAAQ